MAVPQYQAPSSSNVGRKGMLLRIRLTLQKNLRFPRGTVITVPYIGRTRVLGVTAYYDPDFTKYSVLCTGYFFYCNMSDSVLLSRQKRRRKL